MICDVGTFSSFDEPQPGRLGVEGIDGDMSGLRKMCDRFNDGVDDGSGCSSDFGVGGAGYARTWPITW